MPSRPGPSPPRAPSATSGSTCFPSGTSRAIDQFALALAQGHTLILIAHPSDVPRALALGPTYVFSVPLVYERIRARVLEGLGHLPGPVHRFVHDSLEAAARVRVDGASGALDLLRTRAADLLVGRKIRKALGGRIEGLFAGGAPTSVALFRFFEGLGIPMVELYGMSETGGIISSNLLGERRRPSIAGLVTADHELRIAEDHELLLRGPLMLSGYLEAADDADAWTTDGFFKTGDLGELDDEGWLHITGRKKHLLVLSTGKKVAPEPLETALGSTPPFEGALLLGDGRPFVTAAVFVPRGELDRLKGEGKDPAEALLPVALEPLGDFSDYEKPKRLLVVPGSPTDYPEARHPDPEAPAEGGARVPGRRDPRALRRSTPRGVRRGKAWISPPRRRRRQADAGVRRAHRSHLRAPSRRYLWTDAFAVCNLLGLAGAPMSRAGWSSRCG